jgi:hypothetical protein
MKIDVRSSHPVSAREGSVSSRSSSSCTCLSGREDGHYRAQTQCSTRSPHSRLRMAGLPCVEHRRSLLRGPRPRRLRARVVALVRCRRRRDDRRLYCGRDGTCLVGVGAARSAPARQKPLDRDACGSAVQPSGSAGGRPDRGARPKATTATAPEHMLESVAHSLTHGLRVHPPSG